MTTSVQRQAKSMLNYIIKINEGSMQLNSLKIGTKYTKGQVLGAMKLLSKPQNIIDKKNNQEGVKQSNPKLSMRGKKWSKKELTQLNKECVNNIPLREIASAHKRTHKAILAKMPERYIKYYDIDAYIRYIEQYPEKEDKIDQSRLQFIVTSASSIIK